MIMLLKSECFVTMDGMAGGMFTRLVVAGQRFPLKNRVELR